MSTPRVAVGVVDHTVRCDACRALAYFTTYLDGTDLSWCRHHWREFEGKLRTDPKLSVIIERIEEDQ